VSGWPADAPFQWGDTVSVARFYDTPHEGKVLGFDPERNRVHLGGWGWVVVANCTLVKPDVIVWRNVYTNGAVVGLHESRLLADQAAASERTHVLEYNKTHPNKSVLHDVKGSHEPI
jgi:hypothetical protein